MKNKELQTAFAGDRDIAVWVLRYLQANGVKPLALLVSDPQRASHAEELIHLCSSLSPDKIFVGKAFREEEGIDILATLKLDFIICIHFPYIIPPEVLSLPRYGVLNLHPAFLPYNRGWHTPSWALLEGTPIGATLHFMAEGVDTGDIVFQKELAVSQGDTADSLYKKIKWLELRVFEEAWSNLAAGMIQRIPQDLGAGTAHKRTDLFKEEIQQIRLDKKMVAGDLIRKLRALTTNRWDEAAYYEVDGKRYRIRVSIQEEDIT